MCSIRFSVELDEKTGKLITRVTEPPVGQLSGNPHGDYYVYEWFLPAGLPGLISRYNRRLTFVPGPEPRLSFRP
ncbi:MAG: hypothetical protein IKK75_08125, partial [Clostridia bacterium]|nr:hypothetical protein [Clostridia bacterium]